MYNESEKNKRFSDHCVWESSLQGIYYTPHGDEDFAIIQAVQYAPTGKYIGFGEQGGIKLTQNTDQLNYFNFDNMRYRQVSFWLSLVFTVFLVKHKSEKIQW